MVFSSAYIKLHGNISEGKTKLNKANYGELNLFGNLGNLRPWKPKNFGPKRGSQNLGISRGKKRQKPGKILGGGQKKRPTTGENIGAGP